MRCERRPGPSSDGAWAAPSWRGERRRLKGEDVALEAKIKVLRPDGYKCFGCVTAADELGVVDHAVGRRRRVARDAAAAERARGDDALGRVICALPFGRGRPAGDGSHADRTQPRLGVGSVRVERERERESESFVRRSSPPTARVTARLARFGSAGSAESRSSAPLEVHIGGNRGRLRAVAAAEMPTSPVQKPQAMTRYRCGFPGCCKRYASTSTNDAFRELLRELLRCLWRPQALAYKAEL